MRGRRERGSRREDTLLTARTPSSVWDIAADLLPPGPASASVLSQGVAHRPSSTLKVEVSLRTEQLARTQRADRERLGGEECSGRAETPKASHG